MRRVFNKKRNILVLLLIFIMFTGIFYFNDVKVHVYPLLRKIQHELILYKTKDYKVRETEHFLIRYNIEDEETINLVEKASEQYYQQVCDMFHYYPKDKTTVIVYNDPSELMKNASLKQEKPPMGVYFASTIQILSPKLWIPQNEDIEDIFMNEGPMVHEFTHLLVDDLAKGNYPLWFTEGLALYQEYAQTGYEWGKDLSFEGKPYTVKQLTEEFMNLDEMLAYKRSFELVKDIVDTQGFEHLNELLKDLGKGKDYRNYLYK
ncbi:hypothetical protein FQB35_15145 [Crassaminicella thermophila]|uniref:Peptidase MA-like domain-containing protein n=1 Tax=Crassaminicella thermophila TaxID=2599308 RepID=A0A5C0SGQ3_CRATE|nr:hypothetical protein [Crassaminicella thermophila]QEK13491.1 hypothetical protein FQB35_15145 [Crassaminicella thermophila]